MSHGAAPTLLAPGVLTLKARMGTRLMVNERWERFDGFTAHAWSRPSSRRRPDFAQHPPAADEGQPWRLPIRRLLHRPGEASVRPAPYQTIAARPIRASGPTVTGRSHLAGPMHVDVGRPEVRMATLSPEASAY